MALRCTSICLVVPDESKVMALNLDYLVSYERMGFFRVTCEGGCSCGDNIVDG
jgi:hypothetical protein